MGKKATGSKQRAINRGKLASKELVEADAKAVEEDHVTSKSNDALFVLDTDASSIRLTTHVATKKATITKHRGLPKSEVEKVKALVESKTKQQLLENVKSMDRIRRSKRTIGNCQPAFDLWSNEKIVEKKTKVNHTSPGIGMALAGTAPAHTTLQPMLAKKSTYKSVALQVAQSGQSYHPDPTQHQNVIGESLALELRRKEADEYKDAPISAGLSEQTKALMVNSDDDDDDDDESDEEIDGKNQDGIAAFKKKEKLTRAQRNKQKRHRAELKGIFERKQAKKLLNSVAELKKFSKDLEHKLTTNKERKKVIQILKVQTERTLGKDVLLHLSEHDPLNVPAVPVALSCELAGSSLRTVKPKGSLVEDRFQSFRDRKMMDQTTFGEKKKVVQGKRRKVKVKGQAKNRITTEDGGDFLLMG